LVDFKDQNGKRRARQFQTKREADHYMVTARAQVSQGLYIHEGETVRVAEAASKWLGHCARRLELGRRMERATFQDYEGKLRLHILDPEIGLGTIKLSRLTRMAVSEFRDRLLESGRSEATTRKVLTCLSLVVKHAQEIGLIATNPVQGVRVLGTSRLKKKVRVPEKDEVRRLMEGASNGFRPLLAVAVLCGLRASETRGLRWSDVDFENQLIHVRQRADAFNELGEPKSAAGARSVPMGPYVANILKQWKLACPKGSLNLVFPNRNGAVRTHTTVLKRHFKPLCRNLGIEMRWHDLRHFAVSLWIEQGFSVKEVMAFAGHRSVQMTMERYGHLFPSPDHQRGMAEIETRLLG
jgi:integrase